MRHQKQIILFMGTKFALFDPCNEMVYISLDAEQKIKGKAVVDVVVSLLGRSAGPFIQEASKLLITE